MTKEIISTLVDYKTGNIETRVDGIGDSFAVFKNGEWRIYGAQGLANDQYENEYIYTINAPAGSLKYLPSDIPIRSSVMDFEDTLIETKAHNITNLFETVKDLYDCAEDILHNLDQSDFSNGEILKKNLWKNQEALDYIAQTIFYGITWEHFSTEAEWIAEDIVTAPYGYPCLFENEV